MVANWASAAAFSAAIASFSPGTFGSESDKDLKRKIDKIYKNEPLSQLSTPAMLVKTKRRFKSTTSTAYWASTCWMCIDYKFFLVINSFTEYSSQATPKIAKKAIKADNVAIFGKTFTWLVPTWKLKKALTTARQRMIFLYLLMSDLPDDIASWIVLSIETVR